MKKILEGCIKGSNVSDWNDYSTAPKDGSLIKLGYTDNGVTIEEEYIMRWSHITRNGLFQNAVGMWINFGPTITMTWNDNCPEGAPTHWRNLTVDEKDYVKEVGNP